MKSIEKDMLNPKPWQLTGEIEGQKRPENSLLEEYLQYDRTTRLRMKQRFKLNFHLMIFFLLKYLFSSGNNQRNNGFH